MQTFVTITGAFIIPILSILWMVFFYIKFLRPILKFEGYTWRDAMIGVGFFLNIGALATIPMLFGIRLHPVVLVGLGLMVFHAWMKFWVRRPHQTTKKRGYHGMRM